MRAKTTAAVTQQKALWLLEMLFPRIGKRPIREVTPPELLATLRKIEAKGFHETAHRAKQKSGQIFRYTIATGRAERDISSDLRGALVPVVARNHASLTDRRKSAPCSEQSMDEGQPITAAALKLAALVFVRPGELRGARWSEFDLDGAEWRIPAERMKTGELHIIPLARQAVTILRELQTLTGRLGEYVFPSLLTLTRPMSNNTVNTALRRLGYTKEQMTSHGFRSMASTLLNEQGFPPDVIELQLAHAERNKIRAAYNKAQRLAERRTMMQAWADYLDGLRAGPSAMWANQP